MEKIRDKELKTTLSDYIDLLYKYNANMEFYNSKIRLLSGDLSKLEVGFALVMTICVISIVANIVLLCYGYGGC